MIMWDIRLLHDYHGLILSMQSILYFQLMYIYQRWLLLTKVTYNIGNEFDMWMDRSHTTEGSC